MSKSITIIFTDGTVLNTRCKNPSRALSIALANNKAPSLEGVKLARNGQVFGICTGGTVGWMAA